jgi:allophanate hydrolase subunit 2
MFGNMNEKGKGVILKTSFQSSIQDLGRKNLYEYGVPESGAMDVRSFQLANLILGNVMNAPCIEIGLTGMRIKFEDPTEISFFGAKSYITKNEFRIKQGSKIKIEKDDVIEVKRIEYGNWLYLAIKNGFITEKIDSSASWYFPVTPKMRFQKNDNFYYNKLQENRLDNNPNSSVHNNMQKNKIKAWAGQEWHFLNSKQKNKIQNEKFSISSLFNRMAYQLNEKVENNLKNIYSSPTYPGTVQLTPSGTLIILMKDAQVTGGYPRILQIDEMELGFLAQKHFEEYFQFEVIEY